MIYGSVCSGIEAATVAWHPLGWRPAWFAEIAAFPSKVLAHHYPEVPNHGDFTRITDAGAIDLLVGGTPCQSFSVAGLRKGLDDERGNLALEFLRLAHRARPEWVVWENVPGVLSIDDGRAFGSILGGLAELGYGWAYRVLDAQFYGVPQRRRRVFVVGHLGDWRRAAAVLFERACLSWDPPPSRAAGADVAGTLGAGTSGGGWCNDLERSGAFIPAEAAEGVTKTLRSTRAPEEGTPLVPIAIQSAARVRVRKQNGIGVSESDTMYTLDQRSDHAVALFDEAQITSPDNRATAEPGAPAPTLSKNSRLRAFSIVPEGGQGADLRASEIDVAPAITTEEAKNIDRGTRVVGPRPGVRRLTPRECERLQGFPDDYTGIPGAKDGPRYAAIGNSMAVPVMAWIGRRIDAVRKLTNTNTGSKEK